MSLGWLLALIVLGFLNRGAVGSHPGCSHPNGTRRLEAYGNINFTHRIRSKHPDRVQPFFDLGFLLAAGYNQPEARRAFREALKIDDLCAMCLWGLAYARGPFQNKFASIVPESELFNEFSQRPYYLNNDYMKARIAVRYAAALVGLRHFNETEGLLDEIKSDLKQNSSNNTLMSKLPRCNASLEVQDQPAPLEDGGDPSPDPELELLKRERYYIAAMFDRISVEFDGTDPDLWKAAERRFVEDMKEVSRCFPDDADALALAGEALANLSPWFFVVNGTVAVDEPRNITKEVIDLLQKSLQRNPAQPLALHMMIHTTEELPAQNVTIGEDFVAGLGLNSALQLVDMFPTLDHMQHMPSHTFVRVGLWDKAIESNVKALRASVNASAKCLSTLYADHNVAMLVFAASMAAQYETATVYSRVLRELPRFVTDNPYASIGLQWTSPLLVYVRFANWSRIALEAPPPRVEYINGITDDHRGLVWHDLWNRIKMLHANLTDGAVDGDVMEDPRLNKSVVPATTPPQMKDSDYYIRPLDGPDFAVAVWLYSQFMGVANAVQVNATLEANSLLEDIRTNLRYVVDNMITDEAWGVGSPGPGLGVEVPGYHLMATLMLKMAEARFKLLNKDLDEAIKVLEEAAQLEDSAGYYEPPRLAQQPVRQCLGYVYLLAGRSPEAVQTHMEDLRRYPDNPWSISGLKVILAKYVTDDSVTWRSPEDEAAIVETTDILAKASHVQTGGLKTSCPAFSLHHHGK